MKINMNAGLMMSMLFLLALTMPGCNQESSDKPGTGDIDTTAYLGQKPPGEEPVLFAPDIISVDGVQHCFTACSPDGKEIYWMEILREDRKGQILFVEEKDGIWTEPQVASFSGEYNDHSPVFSHDGQKLYFSSSRPEGYGKADIWYVEKVDTGWSSPINLGSPPNSPEREYQPSLCKDGTIYFVTRLDSVQWNRGIYRSAYVDGKYAEPELLGETINSEHADIYPYIAPDESYLLFGSTRPGGNSDETDLYISLKNPDGSWSDPKNLGDKINNGFTATFPFVSHDGRYLFFNRFNESKTDAFYWVDSKVLDSFLNPQ